METLYHTHCTDDVTGLDETLSDLLTRLSSSDETLRRILLRIRELEDAVGSLRDDLSFLMRQLNDPSLMREKGYYDFKSNDCAKHVAMSRIIQDMDNPTDLKSFEERVRKTAEDKAGAGKNSPHYE